MVVCPKKGESARAVALSKVQSFIEETIEQIHNYLGLSMTIAEIGMKDCLTDFSTDCASQ